MEELRLQLGVAIATQLSGEETSKRMKTCVAGRAICPELAGVIANIFHERQTQAQELISSSRVGRDRPPPPIWGIGTARRVRWTTDTSHQCTKDTQSQL